MTPTIELMNQHRSIRKFTDQAITPEQFNAIIDAAQMASTSNYFQACSVIRVNNRQTREKFIALSGGQTWIGEAAEFLVWCVDFNRLKQVAPQAKLGFSEHFIIGVVDTALMAENALNAAESLGLGGVFIGGIRNDPQQVTDLLKLPQHVLPLFGMCLGHPDQQPSKRPRLPRNLMIHDETYQAMDANELADYDQQVRNYYAMRVGSDGQTPSWSEQMAASLAKEARPHMQAFIQSQGFATK